MIIPQIQPKNMEQKRSKKKETRIEQMCKQCIKLYEEWSISRATTIIEHIDEKVSVWRNIVHPGIPPPIQCAVCKKVGQKVIDLHNRVFTLQKKTNYQIAMTKTWKEKYEKAVQHASKLKQKEHWLEKQLRKVKEQNKLLYDENESLKEEISDIQLGFKDNDNDPNDLFEDEENEKQQKASSGVKRTLSTFSSQDLESTETATSSSPSLACESSVRPKKKQRLN